MTNQVTPISAEDEELIYTCISGHLLECEALVFGAGITPDARVHLQWKIKQLSRIKETLREQHLAWMPLTKEQSHGRRQE